MKKIIDISQFNGNMDFNKVNANIEGAIIRVGYRGYSKGSIVIDSAFKRNIEGIKKPKGVYFCTQAISEAEAREEARYTLNMIKGHDVKLPIFIDSEDCGRGAGRADHGKLSRDKRTAIVNAFVDEIVKNGYIGGVYASESWFKTYLNISNVKGFIWVAKYSANKPALNYDAWQYTDRGRINGINGNVDVSYWVKEDAKPTPSKTPVKKSNEEIAEEVIAGKWGNGTDRKKRLESAGYNYNDIQSIVNKRLAPKVEKVYYTIKKGDNLTTIAKKYGTTVNKLKTLNGIKNANLIFAGQKIRIK